jgi:hypothetical protein
MKQQSTLHRTIKKQREYIAKLRSAAKHFKFADSFVKRWSKGEKNAFRYPRVPSYLDYSAVVIECTVKDFKRDAANLIVWIETRGYQCVRTEDQASYSERRFYFRVADSDEDKLVLRFDANLYSGSENCKRVQVGVRKGEDIPIYEFRCA